MVAEMYLGKTTWEKSNFPNNFDITFSQKQSYSIKRSVIYVPDNKYPFVCRQFCAILSC